MSLARTLLRRVAASSRAPLVRQMSDAAAPGLTLNFCLPHDAVYVGKSVEQVIIPGAAASDIGRTSGARDDTATRRSSVRAKDMCVSCGGGRARGASREDSGYARLSQRVH